MLKPIAWRKHEVTQVRNSHRYNLPPYLLDLQQNANIVSSSFCPHLKPSSCFSLWLFCSIWCSKSKEIWTCLAFVMLRFSLILIISFKVPSLALGQSYDCPSASEATLKDMVIIGDLDHLNTLRSDNINIKKQNYTRPCVYLMGRAVSATSIKYLFCFYLNLLFQCMPRI